MVKDEADVVGGMLTHLAGEVDHIVVADNGSTDGTVEIIEGLDVPLTLLHDRETAYYQSAKMTALAQLAADEGADWIVPVDADEIWYAEQRLGDALTDQAPDRTVVRATLFNHFPTAIDPPGDPFQSIVWRQKSPGIMGKVAFKWHPDAVIEQGNHDVQLKTKRYGLPVGVRHFPYRNADQFVRKARNGAAAYRASSLPTTYGLHWRSYGDILDRHGEPALRQVFYDHFHFMSPIDHEMTFDPAPYQRWQNLPADSVIVGD